MSKYFGIIGNNLIAANPMLANKQALGNRKKTCWSCQQDKPQTGGKTQLAVGFHKFVCKDCVDKAKEKKNGNQP
jgi:hypothetical protein